MTRESRSQAKVPRVEDVNNDAAPPIQLKDAGEDMDQDDFFQEPVSLPKANGTRRGSKKRKREGDDTEDVEEDPSSEGGSTESDGAEDEEDHPGPTQSACRERSRVLQIPSAERRRPSRFRR